MAPPRIEFPAREAVLVPKGIWVGALIHTLVAIYMVQLLYPFIAVTHARSPSDAWIVRGALSAVAIMTVCTWLTLFGFRSARFLIPAAAFVVWLYWVWSLFLAIPILSERTLESIDPMTVVKLTCFVLAVPGFAIWCIWFARYLYGPHTKTLFSTQGS